MTNNMHLENSRMGEFSFLVNCLVNSFDITQYINNFAPLMKIKKGKPTTHKNAAWHHKLH